MDVVLPTVLYFLLLWSLRTETKYESLSAVKPRVNCLCEKSSLCEPLSTVPEKEVLGFVVNEVRRGQWLHVSLVLDNNYVPDEFRTIFRANTQLYR